VKAFDTRATPIRIYHRPVLAALLAGLLAAAPVRAAADQDQAPPSGLAQAMLEALEELKLDELHDAGPDEGRCPGDAACPWPLPQTRLPPQLDLAVIRLDADGRAVEAANVQLDGAAPNGRVIRLDRNLAATGVRFRRWSPDRREAGAAAGPFADGEDLAPQRGQAGLDFMAPYPASLFKLLVAFQVERRVDARRLSLESPVTEVVPPPALGEVAAAPETRSLGAWLEAMVTESDNRATKAVLHELHERDEIEPLNRDLARLGLDTLRIDGTSPLDGGRWTPGEIHATAMDLARLLWLVEGGPGVLWRTSTGRAVTRAELPEPARQRLRALLADQGLHDTLSSGSLCGAAAPGIPALVPERFLDPASGRETVGEMPFGRDVRPCNAIAEVRFLHKTGLTWNYAADAGAVEPLPGKPFRRYVVALLSAMGTRFVDPEQAAAPRHPCLGEQICSTRRLARLGAAIDAYAVEAAARDRAARPARVNGR
jgi:Beta-lactamase enzyme family